jgi:hypothetical protein
MKILALNALVIMLVAAPLLTLQLLRSRSTWIEDNHKWLGVVVWLVVLLCVYVFVLPRLGLAPNHWLFE